MKFIFVAAMLLLNFGCSFFGDRSVEELKYDRILKDGNYEIRRYPSYIVAQVTVDDTEDANSKAFKILAGYIFGDNKTKTEMSMTVPVITKEDNNSQKIEMTAPVIMEMVEENKMTMSFSMPSKYSMQDLPEPNDKRVKLVEISQHYMAAFVFSGFWGKEKNEKLGEELKNWLLKHPEYKKTSKPLFAGYNPPWTLPFLRRNEILIKLEK